MAFCLPPSCPDPDTTIGPVFGGQVTHSLFDYIVYDLDTQRIVDFRLKPWADRFLTLRVGLYEFEYSIDTENPPFQEVGTDMPPRRFELLFQP